MAMRLAIDLFCGLGGWAEGFLAEGYDVVGFDIERRAYPAQLVLQDVVTLHGSQFRNARVIVGSPPCQGYSYRAMPFKAGKALGPPDNTLFAACFRIQREASEAAGRRVPLVVENVRGAQAWVGRAAWHYGSFYLWGDVPALMPPCAFTRLKYHSPCSSRLWREREIPRLNQGHAPLSEQTRSKNGGEWFGADCSVGRRFSSRSEARKAAAAQMAKIPFDLARHVAECYVG